MCKKRHAMLLLATVGQLCWLSFALADDTAWVRVVPEETDEILANPGMGWETFHRTANKDKNLPSWIPSTVHYARWGWRELEPEPGKIDYDFLDGVLKETREAGQKLAFRVMCCSPDKGRPYHPKWLKEIGGKELVADHERSGTASDPRHGRSDHPRRPPRLHQATWRTIRRPSRHRPCGSRFHRLVGRVAPERIEELQAADAGESHEGG